MADLFRNRSFVFLLLGQTASGLGGTFATFIMSWLVYELTGSLVAMGSIWVTQMVPSLITQLWSGPYLDRWDRKKVMVVSEWLRAIAFLIPTITFSIGELHVWHLYVTAIMIGIAEPLFRPSSMAFVAEILPKDRLNKGNSLLEGSMQVMFLIGPPLGGVILQWLGAQAVLLLLVGVMGVAGLVLLYLPNKQVTLSETKETWWKQFKAGLKFYRINPVLLGVGLLLMMANFTNGAISPMFLPYVTEILGGGPIQYGLFTSFFSVGMILASLVMGMTKEPENRRKVMLGSMMIIGLCMASLGFVSSFPFAILFIAITGFCMIVFNINNTTMYQRTVPNELRGRVFAVRILLAQAGMPVGAFIGGVIAEAWSIPSLFNIMGGFVVIVTIISFFLPVFHHLNSKNSTAVNMEKVKKRA
ncbi:MFS transporter [Ornithinibacillus salinisoli]|uniref:MFS transporter n=1 Tax=Ornithinibacillus salinisoli TaxID=1848459 RepID=A0ABW4VYQ1_9BACI